MSTRIVVAIVVMVVLVAAGVFDLSLRIRLAAADGASLRAMGDVSTAERESAALKQQIDSANAKGPAAQKSGAVASAPAKRDAGGDRATTIADDPKLRQLSVQAYVGQLRMTFDGLLHRLGLTPDQLRSFDAVQSEYQQAMLDLAASMKEQGMADPKAAAGLRKQLTDARDAHLRELFGDSYRDWEEANRTQGARSNVRQLLQQSFEAGGPVDSAQSEKLIGILAKHQIPKSGGRYDWAAIREETPQLLSGPQLEAFNSATSVKELSDRMTDLSARH